MFLPYILLTICFNSQPREYGLEEYMTIDLHNMQKLEKNRWSGEYMGETYHLKVDEENERITLYK